jgi:cytochrome c oxidase subunit 2
MDPSSYQAREIYRLTNYFFITAAAILLIVCVLTILFLFKYRERPGYKEQGGPANSKMAEAAIVGVPLVLVLVFFVLTVQAMRNIEQPTAGRTPDIIVTGHQWWWQAAYPQVQVTAANEIHLPVGRKLLIQLNSADVIHDWWVPQLGNKMDLVPGRNNFIWLTVDKPGIYEGACSEFCGQQHAWMRIKVFADPPDEYALWLKGQQAQPMATPASAEGAHLFQQLTCGKCHRIAGITNGSAGPDLTHLASRTTLLAGMLPNESNSLKQWLTHPKKIKPGAYMPDFHLDTTSINILTEYLKQLQ